MHSKTVLTRIFEKSDHHNMAAERPPAASQILNREDAARYIGVSQRLFDEYVAMKLITVIRYPGTRGRPGRKIGFRAFDLDEFLNSNVEEREYGKDFQTPRQVL